MMNKRVGAVILARMASTRMPGKVMSCFPYQDSFCSCLSWCVYRVALSKVDNIIIATTDNAENDIFDYFLKNSSNDIYGVQFDAHVNLYRYSGDDEDVAKRVFAAASFYDLDYIVDITSDCPMVDPVDIDYLLHYLLLNDVDYVSNCVERTFPDGCDIQIYTIEALRKLLDNCDIDAHSGWNIGQRSDIFEVRNFSAGDMRYWPDLRLTLDTPQDYIFLHFLFEAFRKKPGFSIWEIVNYLRLHPELLKLNRDVRTKLPEEG